MLDDLKRIRESTNGEELRRKKSFEFGNLVQRRLEYLQNPANCSKAKKAMCSLNRQCGFACQFHHLTYCLLFSYAMNRTLILDSAGWQYSPKGWETVFQPLSNNCLTRGQGSTIPWLGQSKMKEMEKYDVVNLPLLDRLRDKPDFMPLAIPADLADDIKTFHGDPAVWWLGQLVSFLFRPNAKLKQDIENTKRSLGFQKTIVGVHVRRTDKIGDEASYHGIDEYMKHVAEYYTQLARTDPDIVRRVYIASDDPSVLKEAKEKYPGYVFISDNKISTSAQLKTRYSLQSLRGIILDIHLLSRCDYIVCTFSSQVCRVAYEMMQTLHGDASQNAQSLDDIHYFAAQNDHVFTVLENHTDTIVKYKIGDQLLNLGNHWDGFSLVFDKRTRTKELYPSYKLESNVVSVDMPTYPEVPFTQR